MNATQQEKMGLVDYMYGLKKRTVSWTIDWRKMDSFVKTTKEFKKLYEVDDEEGKLNEEKCIWRMVNNGFYEMIRQEKKWVIDTRFIHSEQN